MYAPTKTEQEEARQHEKALDDLLRNEYMVFKKRQKKILKKHEHKCRQIMEKLFQTSFPSIRPDFLRYKNGKNLELDMYNEDLQLAVEYDGIAHRKFCKFFHKSYDDFLSQKERDQFKDQRCKELNITLVRVPDTIPFEQLETYLVDQLRILGFLETVYS
jgi:hypothetical protein